MVQAVATTRAQALSAATPGDNVSDDVSLQPVYLVIMQGSFTGKVPVPPGTAEPTGSYLAMVFDPATFNLLDMGIGSEAPPVTLQSLGPVTTLSK